MRYNSTAAIIVLVLAAIARGAGAQAPTSAVVPEQQAAISALRDSQWVRVVTPGLTRQEGRLLSHERDTLMLDRGVDSLVRIWAMDVDSLWVRGTSWKTGAVIGSVLGAAAGVAYGLAVSEVTCESPDCGASAGAGVAGGVGGLVVGGLVGSLVGTLFPKWHSRWP